MKQTIVFISLLAISASTGTIGIKPSLAFTSSESLSVHSSIRKRAQKPVILHMHSENLEVLDAVFHRSGNTCANNLQQHQSKYHYFAFQSQSSSHQTSNSVIASEQASTTTMFPEYYRDQYHRNYPPPQRVASHISRRYHPTSLHNVYDDWRSDSVADTTYLDNKSVQMCLDEFIFSEYGKQMFGVHERAASCGITGSIEVQELCGPEVILRLNGQFWHRRETVLGRAAMWLNARIPEISQVTIADKQELNDFLEIRDEFTGDVMEVYDRRAPDFNGDRETMEYQGIDPDFRGPFPSSGIGGNGGGGGSMINPMYHYDYY